MDGTYTLYFSLGCPDIREVIDTYSRHGYRGTWPITDQEHEIVLDLLFHELSKS